ncbi:Unknown protein [Striga hermonthica]|uniref:Uncharacterized protein n=1 Tax=Striga hermonthica TaxID=68872 RepID=A0A9N7N5V2_STRHE|nr:Unknown protein [Striga hermonthica]
MNTLRCCISCILPCGALDVVRIVHANGRVEEFSGTVTAAEVLKLHPKHVLKKPTSSPPPPPSSGQRIVVVPPDAELRRGKIYFLMPAPAAPPPGNTRSRLPAKRRKKETAGGDKKGTRPNDKNNNNNSNSDENLRFSDRYLSEILSERVSSQRDRRRGRVGVWRPHLESISEAPPEV